MAQASISPAQQTLAKTCRQILDECFNQSELKNLCFDLGVEYEELPGESPDDKARELVEYFVRRGRLQELAKKCFELRPAVADSTPLPELVSLGSKSEPRRNLLALLRDPMWQGLGVIVTAVACIAAFAAVPEIRQVLSAFSSTPTPVIVSYGSATSTRTAAPLTGTPTRTVTPTPMPTPTATTPSPTPTAVITISRPTLTVTPAVRSAQIAYGVLTAGSNRQTVADGITLRANSEVYFRVTNLTDHRLLIENWGLGLRSNPTFIHGGLVNKQDNGDSFYLEINETVEVKVSLGGVQCSPCEIFPSMLIPRKLNPVEEDPRDWMWMPGPSYRVNVMVP